LSQPLGGNPAVAMTFEQILDAATELLQRKQRLTYAALKRQFDVDDEVLGDLKQKLTRSQRVARDEDRVVLVWRGHGPNAAKRRVEAERRQLTVVFWIWRTPRRFPTPLTRRKCCSAFEDPVGNLAEALEAVAKPINGAEHYAEHYFGFRALSAARRADRDVRWDNRTGGSRFRGAIKIAQRQGAKMFELRAAVSIAWAIAPAAKRDRTPLS
jgi:hypothetical protein